MADYLNIAGRIRTTASDGVSMEASEVFDESLEKSQSEINNSTIRVEKQVLSEGQQAQVLSNIMDTNANNDGKIGYKVLQPETKATFQSQVTEPNTIYEIRDVFDLEGTIANPVTVNLPAGSILKFNGGVIKNCKLVGNSTSIECTTRKQIFSNVELVSGFVIEAYDASWWGAKEGQDVSDALQDCYNSYKNTTGTPIKLIGKYLINKTVHCPAGIVLWNGYANVCQNPNYEWPGTTAQNVCEIDVAEGVTAFEVSWAGVPLPTLYYAEVSFSGIKAYCSSILSKIGNNDFDWDDIEETQFLHYAVGGRPTRGFKIENCLFDGFTKTINANMPYGRWGSIMSGVLVDNCVFDNSKYSIYTANENEGWFGPDDDQYQSGDLTINNLDIIRCSFSNTSLYLDGIYGTNRITLSTFEGSDSPIYAHLKYGILYLTALYIENDKGVIRIVGEKGFKSSHNDFQAIVHIDDWYYPAYSYASTSTAPGHELSVSLEYVTVESIPNLFPRRSITFSHCAIAEDVLKQRNYASFDTASIPLVNETFDNNGTEVQVQQSVNVIKTDNCLIKGRFDSNGYYPNVPNKNSYFSFYYEFDRSDASYTLNKRTFKDGQLQLAESNGNFSLALNTSIFGMSSFADSSYVILTFYKTQDPYVLVFKNSSNNVVTKITTPYICGICVVKVPFSLIKTVTTIEVEPQNYMVTTHQMSDIACFVEVNNGAYTINTLVKLIDTRTQNLVVEEGTVTDQTSLARLNDVNIYRYYKSSTGTTNRFPIFKDLTQYVNCLGFPVKPLRGYTSERPSLTSGDAGYFYYDELLGKYIIWNGSAWTNVDGSPLVAKSGTTSQRPTFTSGTNAGFQYFDTTLGKYICWSGTAWINLDGTALS